MIYNYRLNITKKGLNVDYWNKGLPGTVQFRDVYNEYEDVLLFFKLDCEGKIKYWFFFEPYLEINWISYSGIEYAVNFYDKMVKEFGSDYEISLMTPEDGQFADWFCESESEMFFGAMRHDICRQFVEVYHDSKIAVDSGKGLHAQVGRTIHTLCNPLGLNYKDEAKICFSRGLICFLFSIFSFKKAVWIYTKIFRQRY